MDSEQVFKTVKASITVSDREGKVIFMNDASKAVFGDKDYITDIAEFGGKIYLSAYAVPTQSGFAGRDEIASILNYIYKNHGDDIMNISDEELTPIVRDNYTAVLLVCDTESGTPTTFYSVKGSLGGKFAVSDGKLTWDVETVMTTFYSPATSSFTVGGTCAVFRYTFDISGTIVEQKDTGETVKYRR